jgi:hypothetical protein
MRMKTLLLSFSIIVGACGTDRNKEDRSEASPEPSASQSAQLTAKPSEPAAGLPSTSPSPSPTDLSPRPDPNGSASPEPLPSPTVGPSNEPENSLKPTIESIQTSLINKKCLSCHQSALETNGWVDLRDLRENISAFPGRNPELNRARATIMTGCPDYSILSLSLKNGTMPPAPAPHISTADIALVDTWIRSLEPNRSGCSK